MNWAIKSVVISLLLFSVGMNGAQLKTLIGPLSPDSCALRLSLEQESRGAEVQATTAPRRPLSCHTAIFATANSLPHPGSGL
jgi:hypothetical protein